MKKTTYFLSLFTLVSLLLLGISAYADASINVVGSLTHERITGIGISYNGGFQVKNSGQTPCTIRVYQTDYLYYADGRNIYGPPGGIPRSNADWITLGSNWITIPPQGTATVNYEVSVPPSSALKGTYWSMLMVEAVEDQPLLGNQKSSAIALQTKIRYGVQIITNISNSGTRRIQFIDRRLLAQDGQRILQLDIENTGERVLFPTVSLQLFNNEGKLIGDFQGKKARILPTCSVRQQINLTKIPTGKYKALVIVDNGDQYVFGANYDLVIEK